jgi:hypothetical protein
VEKRAGKSNTLNTFILKKKGYENVLFFPFQNLYHNKSTQHGHGTRYTQRNARESRSDHHHHEEEDGHTNVLIGNYERAKSVIVETGGTECRQHQHQQAFIVVWEETNFGRGIDF